MTRSGHRSHTSARTFQSSYSGVMPIPRNFAIDAFPAARARVKINRVGLAVVTGDLSDVRRQNVKSVPSREERAETVRLNPANHQAHDGHEETAE
jgi:hypothetical protein